MGGEIEREAELESRSTRTSSDIRPAVASRGRDGAGANRSRRAWAMVVALSLAGCGGGDNAAGERGPTDDDSTSVGLSGDDVAEPEPTDDENLRGYVVAIRPSDAEVTTYAAVPLGGIPVVTELPGAQHPTAHRGPTIHIQSATRWEIVDVPTRRLIASGDTPNGAGLDSPLVLSFPAQGSLFLTGSGVFGATEQVFVTTTGERIRAFTQCFPVTGGDLCAEGPGLLLIAGISDIETPMRIPLPPDDIIEAELVDEGLVIAAEDYLAGYDLEGTELWRTPFDVDTYASLLACDNDRVVVAFSSTGGREGEELVEAATGEVLLASPNGLSCGSDFIFDTGPPFTAYDPTSLEVAWVADGRLLHLPNEIAMLIGVDPSTARLVEATTGDELPLPDNCPAALTVQSPRELEDAVFLACRTPSGVRVMTLGGDVLLDVPVVAEPGEFIDVEVEAILSDTVLEMLVFPAGVGASRSAAFIDPFTGAELYRFEV